MTIWRPLRREASSQSILLRRVPENSRERRDAFQALKCVLLHGETVHRMYSKCSDINNSHGPSAENFASTTPKSQGPVHVNTIDYDDLQVQQHLTQCSSQRLQVLPGRGSLES